eukprot:1158775-Pelagomonas_calceolata.AAC.2
MPRQAVDAFRLAFIQRSMWRSGLTIQKLVQQGTQQCMQQGTQQCCADAFLLACALWHTPVLSKRLRQFLSVACDAPLTCPLKLMVDHGGSTAHMTEGDAGKLLPCMLPDACYTLHPGA